MEFAVFFLSVFAVFVASTAAPMPCDTPEQWEGTATLQDQENGELYIISLSYDAKNNRTRSFTVLLNGQEHKMREVILLHEQNIFFFIMVNIKVCIVTPAFFEFQPANVPEDAVFRSTISRGLEDNSVVTNTFALSYEVPRRVEDAPPTPPYLYDYGHEGHNHSWFASFTNDECGPVLETVYEGDLLDTPDFRFETIYNIKYNNMTLGIKSTDVFEPPSYCSISYTLDDIPDSFRRLRFFYA